MNASTAFGILINIGFIICVFFAVPIVAPVAGLLSSFLTGFAIFYAFGVFCQIWIAYNPPVAK
jgi:hypothetical protein